ncbi:uncharacterized protein KIAA1614 homolog isoform X2 [Amia ocellicauda]|uniref:uncharacterized protein KIAA1614 homolog isoform X2 n=1 Tax=Amia ocellicauda TaxID=2972642 RepID=UPI0034646596
MEEVAVAESICPSNVPHRAGVWKKCDAALPLVDSSPSPEPVLCSPVLHQAPGSAVSALQSKVKALSERRAAGKEEKGASLCTQRSHSVAPTGRQVPGQQVCNDEEVDPKFQVHTYLTDNVLHSEQEEQNRDSDEMGTLSSLALPRGLGEGASLENLSNGNGLLEEPPTKPWAPPKGFWKATRPETLLLSDSPQKPSDWSLSAEPQDQLWGLSGHRKPRPGGPQIRRELQRSDSLESHLRRAVRQGPPLGGLWRADSWESVCSNSSALSLAERVEMNRGILKQMLNKPKCKEPETGLHSPEHKVDDLSECNGRGLCTLNDSDWDSGISLQDSEQGHRAFVSCEELPLSPRHEQAKRLLERARMKARSHPLKADHSILPVQKDTLEPSGNSRLRRGLTGKEGSAPACGNLSDSSSGDSGCGPRRRHGQSPTRVRFEDESAQDAEVRYLERLQQRRRAAERGQGLLVSKPHLSSYINGVPTKREGGSGKAERGRSPEGAPLWSKKTRRNHEGSHANTTSSDKAGKKCNSCGSFLEGADQSLLLSKQGQIHLSNTHALLQEVCPYKLESTVKAIPCWVPPSHHRVRTERIKETYIGEVTAIDDIDSGREDGTYRPAGDTDHMSVSGQALYRQEGKGNLSKDCLEETPRNGTGENCQSLNKTKKRSKIIDGGIGGTNNYGREVAAINDQDMALPQENPRPSPNGAENGSPSSKSTTLPPNPYNTELNSHVPSPSTDEVPVPPLVEVPVCNTHPNSDLGPSSMQPKKSALKSGSKNRPNGQRVVKVLPSLQYRLIHLDTEDQDSYFSQGGDPQGSDHHASLNSLHHSLDEHLCAVLSYGSEELANENGRRQPCVSTNNCNNTHTSRPASLKCAATRAVGDQSVPAALELSNTASESGHQLNGSFYHLAANTVQLPEFHNTRSEPLSNGDSRHRGPLKAEHTRESTAATDSAKNLEMREGRPRLSLRRFLSAISQGTVGKLGKGRSSSMEHLSGTPIGSGSPPCAPHKHSGQLKKTPSLQSLRLGSPFSQLRKASSVQSLQSPKRKGDRSSAYLVGEPSSFSPTHRGLQRALSVEDVGCPSGVRAVGRVAQAFADGTLLLELSHPANGPFGFVISRGKGRPDSGVYVDAMGDSGTQKLYAGLLGVGDEILEVNGEKVAGLTLEEVTWLMTEHSTAAIRVLRQRRSQR